MGTSLVFLKLYVGEEVKVKGKVFQALKFSVGAILVIARILANAKFVATISGNRANTRFAPTDSLPLP
jgi:hypothetical protein